MVMKFQPLSLASFTGIKSLKILIVLLSLVSGSANSQTLSESISKLLNTNSCPHCDLSGADLSGQELIAANLEAANLSGANLSGTNLIGANLSFSILKSVIFLDTRLAGANLRNADLTDLDIDVAFEWLEITGTQLEGARFKYGVTCGPPPEKGGWGCQHI